MICKCNVDLIAKAPVMYLIPVWGGNGKGLGLGKSVDGIIGMSGTPPEPVGFVPAAPAAAGGRADAALPPPAAVPSLLEVLSSRLQAAAPITPAAPLGSGLLSTKPRPDTAPSPAPALPPASFWTAVPRSAGVSLHGAAFCLALASALRVALSCSCLPRGDKPRSLARLLRS